MGIKLCLLQKCTAAVCNMTCVWFLASMYFLMFAKVGEDFKGGVTSRTRVGALIRVGESVALKVRLSHKTLVTTRLCTDERSFSWGEVSLYRVVVETRKNYCGEWQTKIQWGSTGGSG